MIKKETFIGTESMIASDNDANCAMRSRSWNNGTMSDNDVHKVGVVQSEGHMSTNRMCVSLCFPEIQNRPHIMNAELKFNVTNVSVGLQNGLPLGLYLERGPESTDVAEDNMPIAYTVVKSAGECVFDITRMANVVSVGDDSEQCVVLKLMDENIHETAYAEVSGVSSVSAPRLTVTYDSSYGVADAGRVHTHEIDRFGRASIDLACGNLMFESTDFEWMGNRKPVTLKHFYNSNLCNYRYTGNNTIRLSAANFDAMHLGFGWRLNVMQSIIPVADIEGSIVPLRLVHIDELGHETMFVQSNNNEVNGGSATANIYEAEDGSGYLYNASTRILTCGDETHQFDASGRLINIADKFGNTMVITYNNDKISSVVDGAGRIFVFNYIGEKLASIVSPDGTMVSYSYENDLLSAIAYPDGTTALITYENNNLPNAVSVRRSTENPYYIVAYTFDDNMVSEVEEFCVVKEVDAEGNYFDDLCPGKCTTYTYSSAERRTAAKYAMRDGSYIVSIYTFDDEGNVLSEYAYSQDGVTSGVNGGDSGIHPYAGDGGAYAIPVSVNLLQNSNFINSGLWEMVSTTNPNFTCTRDYVYGEAKFGRQVLCMQYDENTYDEDGINNYDYTATERGMQQNASAPIGALTFSTYVRILNEVLGTDDEGNVIADNPGVYLRVLDASGNRIIETERVVKSNGEYLRLIAPFELSEAQNITVQILMDGKGKVYVNGAQLETNEFAAPYNMIANGHFGENDVTNAWTCTSGATFSNETYFNSDRSLRVSGSVDAQNGASQEIPVHQEIGTRETFTLSGWAKGCGTAGSGKFSIKAEIYYEDGTVEKPHEVPFSSAVGEWHFASVQFGKSEFKRASHIKVSCNYDYAYGTVYFDDIQLIQTGIETDLDKSDFLGADDGTNDSTNNETTENYEKPETVDEETSLFEEYVDEYGNTVTETTFANGEFGTIYRAFGHDESGNNLIKEIDARGNVFQYTVDPQTSKNLEVIDRCGNKTAYEYDAAGRTTMVTNKDFAEHTLAAVRYLYDDFGNLGQIQRGDGMRYVLQYDGFHNLQSIHAGLNATPLIEYTYKENNGRLKRVTYRNGDNMHITYNSMGQMTAEKWHNAENTLTAHYRYVYDGDGNIVRSIDILAGEEYNYIYEQGRLVRSSQCNVMLRGEMVVEKTHVNSIRYIYNAEGTLTKKIITPAGGTEQIVFIEETENGSNTIDLKIGDVKLTTHSKTDSFGRKVFDEIQTGIGFVSRQFAYYAGQIPDEHRSHAKIKSAAMTQLVSQIILSDGRTLSYEYDAEERITRVTDSLEGTTEYTYDAMGQLLKETKDGVVVNEMTYDNYGNIKTKNGISYGYAFSPWKDLLLHIGDQDIEYDEQGNPTSYLGHTLTWEKGRQLKSFDRITYSYNANGIRTVKNANGRVHTYTLDGTKILRETWSTNELIPLYDNEESVCGILYNGVPFYFLKNLQGDIIAITDANGETVARYSYDAWGACTVLSDTSGYRISYFNPYRYRGYYYDRESNLYYLQSRYYDPAVGRFINADDSTIVVQYSGTFEALNWFAYCSNNPVNEKDESGRWRAPKLVACGIQLEADVSMISIGFEIIFANGNVYLYRYGGFSYGKSMDDILNWIQTSLISSFSKSAIKKSIKKLFSASVSVCVFAIFDAMSSRFSSNNYEGPFFTVYTTVPTMYGVAGKTYVSTWSYITGVGIGFSYPSSFDYGVSKTKYTLCKKINLSASIRNFVNKKTKGLKT